MGVVVVGNFRYSWVGWVVGSYQMAYWMVCTAAVDAVVVMGCTLSGELGLSDLELGICQRIQSIEC